MPVVFTTDYDKPSLKASNDSFTEILREKNPTIADAIEAIKEEISHDPRLASEYSNIADFAEDQLGKILLCPALKDGKEYPDFNSGDIDPLVANLSSVSGFISLISGIVPASRTSEDSLAEEEVKLDAESSADYDPDILSLQLILANAFEYGIGCRVDISTALDYAADAQNTIANKESEKRKNRLERKIEFEGLFEEATTLCTYAKGEYHAGIYLLAKIFMDTQEDKEDMFKSLTVGMMANNTNLLVNPDKEKNSIPINMEQFDLIIQALKKLHEQSKKPRLDVSLDLSNLLHHSIATSSLDARRLATIYQDLEASPIHSPQTISGLKDKIITAAVEEHNSKESAKKINASSCIFEVQGSGKISVKILPKRKMVVGPRFSAAVAAEMTGGRAVSSPGKTRVVVDSFSPDKRTGGGRFFEGEGEEIVSFNPYFGDPKLRPAPLHGAPLDERRQGPDRRK